MTNHRLKCWPAEIWAIRRLEKTCEVRRADDREFSVGDVLELMPWDPATRSYVVDAPGVSVCVTWLTRACGPSNLFTLTDGDDDASADVVQYERPVVVMSFRMLNPFYEAPK